MARDIYAAEGNSSDEVTTYQNEPTSPRPTPILEISPERGQFLRFLNEVQKGDEIGIPIYMDLRDVNNDPLPINTGLYLEIEPSGSTGGHVVSEELKSIDQYVRNSLSDQQDADKIDAAKVTLQVPEGVEGSGPVRHHDVRDIDSMYLMADGPAQIDWSNSSVYFESNAVEQHGRGR